MFVTWAAARALAAWVFGDGYAAQWFVTLPVALFFAASMTLLRDFFRREIAVE